MAILLSSGIMQHTWFIVLSFKKNYVVSTNNVFFFCLLFSIFVIFLLFLFLRQSHYVVLTGLELTM